MRFPVIKDYPEYIGKAKKVSVKIFQFPNGNYHLFIRRPTKTWSRVSRGYLIGTYHTIEKAQKAAYLWYKKWTYNG